MSFSTKYGWHGDKAHKRMIRNNPWIYYGKYRRNRSKSDRKRKAKKQRQFIRKCKEGILTLLLLAGIITSVIIYIKNINQ
jgi:hypothetical protein